MGMPVNFAVSMDETRSVGRSFSVVVYVGALIKYRVHYNFQFLLSVSTECHSIEERCQRKAFASMTSHLCNL